MRNRSAKVAFCGVIAALSVVLMLLTGLVPIATVAIPAIAGCFMIAVVIEAGIKWGVGVYAAVSVLSFVLAPDREAALFYVLFFGYFPIVFAVIGRIKNKAVRFLIKLAIYNAAMAVELWLSVNLLGIPLDQTGAFGKYTILVLVILLNIVFVLYNYAMHGLIFMYLNKFHDKVQKIFNR